MTCGDLGDVCTLYHDDISTVSRDRISTWYHAVSERIMDVVSSPYQTVSRVALYQVRIRGYQDVGIRVGDQG